MNKHEGDVDDDSDSTPSFQRQLINYSKCLPPSQALKPSFFKIELEIRPTASLDIRDALCPDDHRGDRDELEEQGDRN